MRATRFGLESRLGRQLAHDDPILMWIPTLQVTRSRDSGTVRLRDSGKVPMTRRLGDESKAESGPEIHWSLVSSSS